MTTYPPSGDIPPLIHVKVVDQPKTAPEVIRATYRLVTLAVDPEGNVASSELLPPSDRRVCAYVQALDDDVIVSGNESDAKQGAGLVIPANNTAPWPIYDQGQLYVACRAIGGTTARVSVSASYRA